MSYQARDLFQVESELVDAKMQIAANNAIDGVVAQMENLRTEIHELNHRISGIDARLAAVETKLGMRDKIRGEIHNRTIEYVFKAGWLILASIGMGAYIYFRI